MKGLMSTVFGGPLAPLEAARDARFKAQCEWEAQLHAAIVAGVFSERQIAKAAGISGPAVHQRKIASQAESNRPGGPS
jgi:hypothetical protein